ncbi:MAG: hypothetical protein OHK0038_18960 [Flammeovirgaceae bacterium]
MSSLLEIASRKFNTLKRRTERFLAPKIGKDMIKKQPVLRLGNEYSFCYVPQNLLHKNSVVYSFGAGEDISTDIEIAKTFACPVRIFDPTPRALTHFQNLIEKTKKGKKMNIENGKRFYEVDTKTLPLLNFYSVGLWNEDTKVKFFAPKNPQHVSYSITNLQQTEEYIEVEVKKITTLMKEFANDKIDYLKMDIEGAEYKVLDSFFIEKPNISSLYIEFHYPAELSFRQGAQKIKDYLIKLTTLGYDIVCKENERNFLLIKVNN